MRDDTCYWLINRKRRKERNRVNTKDEVGENGRREVKHMVMREASHTMKGRSEDRD